MGKHTALSLPSKAEIQKRCRSHEPLARVLFALGSVPSFRKFQKSSLPPFTSGIPAGGTPLPSG